MSIEHSDAPAGEIHVWANWEYADAAARGAATGFVPGDVGKIAWQQDDDSFWLLTDDSPITWVQVAGTAPPAHASTHENGGSDEIDVTGLSGVLADPQTPASHTHTSSDITDFAEAVEDKIGAKVVAGTGMSVSYNDATGETTITNTSPDSGSPPSTEDVQDIVGAMLTDSADIDFSYDDGAGTATAVLVNSKKETMLGWVIDGGGANITTGVKGDLGPIPFACTILEVALLADQSGSIVVDIWKDTYANFPPVVGDSITASAKPTLSSAAKSQDSTLTGWTTAIAAGDILRFNVDSVTGIQRVTIILKVRRS